MLDSQKLRLSDGQGIAANLAELGLLDDPVGRQALEQFLDDTLRQFRLLEQAIDAADLNQIEQWGHRLKGGAQTLGDWQLADLGAAVEDAGKIGDLTGARSSLTSARLRFEVTENQVRQLLRAAPGGP